MNERNKLFEKVFSDLLGEADNFQQSLAFFVHDVVSQEFRESLEHSENASSHSSFEVTVEKFKRVVELFNKITSAKHDFLMNFELKLSPDFMRTNKLLRECAKPIQNNDFCYDVAKFFAFVAGSSVCLSTVPLLGVVTVPIAVAGGIVSALGGAVGAANTIREFYLMKEKLKEAKSFVLQEVNGFSAVSNWFTNLEELKKSLETLIDYNVLEEMTQDFIKFFDGLKYQTNLTVGEFKDRLRKVLKFSVRKMIKEHKLEFDKEITPVVMTFVFIFCLIQDQNRIVLECIMASQRLKLGLRTVLGIDGLARRPFTEIAPKGSAGVKKLHALVGVKKSLVTDRDIGDLPYRPLTEIAPKGSAGVKKLLAKVGVKKSHVTESDIGNLPCRPLTEIAPQVSAGVKKLHAPVVKKSLFTEPDIGDLPYRPLTEIAPKGSADVKKLQAPVGVKKSLVTERHIGDQPCRPLAVIAPKGSAGVKKLQAPVGVKKSLVTELNIGGLLTVELSVQDCWIELTKKIELSAEEFEEAFLFVEKIYGMVKEYERISKVDVIPLTTIIVNSVPDDATEEDVKIAVQLHVPEEAWDCIQLEQLSTHRNNWLVQIPPRHSQLLFQQAAIVIKEKRCFVIQ